MAFDGLQAEGSAGPLNVVALVQQSGAGSSPAFFESQVLPPLTLHASVSSVGSSSPTKITFTVSDASDPVTGAWVTFLGQKAVTNSSGLVHLWVKKGTTAGNHQATASKPGYAATSVTVRVT